jgi:HEAT repeat protein
MDSLEPTVKQKKRIAFHIERLGHPNKKIAIRAEHNLIRYYGSKALQELITACSRESPQVRFRAVWALAHTHEASAFETILRLTDDPDEGVRYDATVALGIHGGQQALEHLVRILLLEDETRPAGMGLARLGISVVPALENVFGSAGAVARWVIVQIIGDLAVETRDSVCLKFLQRAQADPDPQVRENVEFWLDECRETQ